MERNQQLSLSIKENVFNNIPFKAWSHQRFKQQQINRKISLWVAETIFFEE